MLAIAVHLVAALVDEGTVIEIEIDEERKRIEERGEITNACTAWQRTPIPEFIEKLDLVCWNFHQWHKDDRPWTGLDKQWRLSAAKGAEISPEDRVQWAALSPVRGQVLEVFLPETDTHDPPFAWAAFLIGRVSTRLDGSIVLECRHLGAEDTPYSQVLDGQFNDARRRIHLCLTRPCLMTEEKDDADTPFMHVTRIRLWSWDRFISVQEYVAASSLDAGCRLVESDRSSDAKHTWAPLQKSSQRERETYWEKERDQDTKGERGAQKARACRRRRGAGDIWQRRKAKKKEEEKATREELRSRLKAVRERLQDPGTIRVEDGYSPGTPVAEDVSSGSEDEGSSWIRRNA